MTTDSFVPADDPRASTPEALGAALSKPADEPTLAGPCPQPGCLRPTVHPGTRHRYSPTKELQPEPEAGSALLPELDKRPFSGPLEDRPRNHAISVIDAESGLYVAWDHCAGCRLHLTLCSCISGPKEPEYIRRWREQAFPINDPAKPTIPKVDDLVGIDPDYTGDLSTDEFIRRQRETDEENEYETLADCQEAGVHLTSCDEDGYCNFCGHQDGGDEEPPMALAAIDPDNATIDPEVGF